MGILKKTGGKWWLALLALLPLAAVLVIAAVQGKLDVGLAGILTGAMSWTLTQFGFFNTANNKAALAAGKAKDETANALATATPGDVLAAAGAATGSDVAGTVERIADGAVASGARCGDECRAGVHAAADAARDALRSAATDHG